MYRWLYEHGVVYQDFPEDEPYLMCLDCGEKVYPGKMQRHVMKDHDYEVAAIAIDNNIPYLKVIELVAG